MEPRRILFKGAAAPPGSSPEERQTLTKPDFISGFRAMLAVPGDPGRGCSGKGQNQACELQEGLFLITLKVRDGEIR